MLAISVEGQCGRECLILDDDDVESRTFSCVFRNLKQFFVLNKEDIQKLEEEGFFQPYTYDYGHISSNVRSILTNITTNQKSYIVEDYSKIPSTLKKHLKEIKSYIQNNRTANDLEEKQVTELLTYTNCLILILRALNVK